jgi:hypothetical protein
MNAGGSTSNGLACEATSALVEIRRATACDPGLRQARERSQPAPLDDLSARAIGKNCVEFIDTRCGRLESTAQICARPAKAGAGTSRERITTAHLATSGPRVDSDQTKNDSACRPWSFRRRRWAGARFVLPDPTARSNRLCRVGQGRDSRPQAHRAERPSTLPNQRPMAVRGLANAVGGDSQRNRNRSQLLQ